MDLWESTNPDTVKLEDCYKGLKIKLPMKAETVVKLTEFYKCRRVSNLFNKIVICDILKYIDLS